MVGHHLDPEKCDAGWFGWCSCSWSTGPLSTERAVKADHKAHLRAVRLEQDDDELSLTWLMFDADPQSVDTDRDAYHGYEALTYEEVMGCR